MSFTLRSSSTVLKIKNSSLFKSSNIKSSLKSKIQFNNNGNSQTNIQDGNLTFLNNGSSFFNQFPNSQISKRDFTTTNNKNNQNNIDATHSIISQQSNNSNLISTQSKTNRHYSLFSNNNNYFFQQQKRTLVTHTPEQEKEMMRPVLLHSMLTKPANPPTSKPQKHVLVLHGVFGQGKNWRGVTRKFPDEENVVCHLLDMRCHGTSPRSPYLTYSAMAEDILYYINTNQLDNVSIVGHSMGGKASMLFALKYPNRVDKLCIVDIAPVNYPELKGFQNYIKWMSGVPLNSIKSRRDADEYLQQFLPQYELRQFFLTNLVESKDPNTGHVTWRWLCDLPVISKYLEDIRDFHEVEEPKPISHATFTKPTIFIGGGESNYLKSYTSDVYRYFPSAKVELIPGAGHWVHSEKPKEFFDLLSQFLLK